MRFSVLPSSRVRDLTSAPFSSVSEDLLCAFELLKPLDGAALRKEMTKAKRKR
jgi:serine/threonine-protein phosphatase PP1 catalytic subunit